MFPEYIYYNYRVGAWQYGYRDTTSLAVFRRITELLICDATDFQFIRFTKKINLYYTVCCAITITAPWIMCLFKLCLE